MTGEVLSGTGVTPLSGVGVARWHDPGGFEFEREADDPEREAERFRRSREEAREAILAARERALERVGEEEAAVFDTHRQFLEDPQIEEAVLGAVEDGLSAEAAVEDAFATHTSSSSRAWTAAWQSARTTSGTSATGWWRPSSARRPPTRGRSRRAASSSPSG
jgi:phosphoenolpyruvate-protein kinase (PTS system EI component)